METGSNSMRAQRISQLNDNDGGGDGNNDDNNGKANILTVVGIAKKNTCGTSQKNNTVTICSGRISEL